MYEIQFSIFRPSLEKSSRLVAQLSRLLHKQEFHKQHHHPNWLALGLRRIGYPDNFKVSGSESRSLSGGSIILGHNLGLP